ncbi:MAG TPA: NUDIX domain-containing protein [Candidatus Sulfotelmatobacter sp.]|jgi:ADP-ribose pyrophosphatase YjhB (NUDIX family)|nr:NUDIX domain-containing protein [Candidatus Sulfotelmatobacter sp.]
MQAGPVVGVGTVVMKGQAVLLIRRAHPPRAGSWSLPGGKQKRGETVLDAARRELAEETGLTDVLWLGVADVVDLMDRAEDGTLRFHYTVVDFAALWRAGDVRAGDDADAAAWVTQDQFDAYGVTPLVRSVVGKAQTLRDAASSGL